MTVIDVQIIETPGIIGRLEMWSTSPLQFGPIMLSMNGTKNNAKRWRGSPGPFSRHRLLFVGSMTGGFEEEVFGGNRRISPSFSLLRMDNVFIKRIAILKASNLQDFSYGVHFLSVEGSRSLQLGGLNRVAFGLPPLRPLALAASLVRPDGFIAWCAQDVTAYAPEAVEQLVMHLLCR